MGIATDTRKLDPPLKGKLNGNYDGNDNKGKNTSSDCTATTNTGGDGSGAGQLSGVRWRLLRLGRKVDAQRRLVVLRGYARAGDSRLRPVQIRAMIDSGAQTEIMSPDLARRLGGKIVQGQFGVAVEAFGRETPLTQQARNVELRLPGTNPRSLLAQDFLTRWDFIVSPHSLSSDYDLLLGTRFIRRFRLNLNFHEPCVIRLTAENGSETMLEEETGPDDQRLPEEHIEQERGVASVSQAQASEPAARRPPTHSQRRAMLREWRESEEWRMQQAARAAKDPATKDTVMTMEELEHLWSTSKPGSVKIFMIQARGLVGEATHTPVAAAKLKQAGQQASKVSAVSVAQQEADGSLLPLEERVQAERMVRQLQADFADVFPEELPAGPSERDSEPFRIELKEGTRPFGRYGPRMTEENTAAAGKMIKDLLAKGFIRASRSPWGSPMFLVDKPDGSKRMVIDYRALNAATSRNRYPLPRVDELFDQLQGARYFSKLDLRTGYWQIRVAAEDVPKTAFTSRHGHFEWLVLPMGLTNAPAEFMALMENTFREELNKFVLVFLDDILVYSRTLEEHQQQLRVVLLRLREQKLYAKLSKCCFFRQEVEFLGHFVGRAGVRMVEGKVAAVERWPKPTTQKEVEQFLGLAGYYRRFIAGFSKLAAPLSELCGTLKKSKSGAQRAPPKKLFAWGEQQQQAFEQLKAAVTSAPCLAIPDPSREFIVHTDASGYATGAVLMQQFDEGLRPIAFLSKKMTKAERNYPVHEQELLAILNALKAWRHYLGGRRFSVLTDHQSLQYVETSAMATPRQVRWAAWLSEFDFSIKYSPGKTNVAADALSRAAAGREEARPAIEVNSLLQQAQRRGSPVMESSARLLVSAINALAPLPVRIREAAAADAEYQAAMVLPHEALEGRKLVRHGRLLYRDDGRLVVPNSATLRTWLLSSAHDTLLGGHHSAAATAAWLGERVWWPDMVREAERYVRGCEQCQRNKPDLRGKQGLPLSIHTPSRPWEVICMDFIGPLPRTVRGHDTIMVVVDKLTRWVYYIPTRQTATAQDTFALLDRFVLANHDTPRQIISDRDTRFTSHFWEDLWAAMRTQLKRSTAFHPQTDGQTERANRTLIEQLRSHVDEHQADWDLLLPQLQRANNSAVCFSTGFSPFEMNHGRKLHTELDAELEADGVAPRAGYPGARELAEQRARVETEARERIQKAQAKQRKDAQQGRRAGEIIPGDKVWLSNRHMRLDEQGRARKLEPLFFGPYEVLEMHGTNAARLRLPEECKLHPVFNLDLLRRFVDGAAEFPDRPVRHNRPGPIPEEDPAAGGPAAAGEEPEYEVEAIIGSRGRGARQSYRVKWLGWPLEQASWRPAAECRETCPERVRAFEETQRQRRRAVHILRTVEQEKSDRRLQWSLQAQGGAAVGGINSDEEESLEFQSPASSPSSESSSPLLATLAVDMAAKVVSNAGGRDDCRQQQSQQVGQGRAGTGLACIQSSQTSKNNAVAGGGNTASEGKQELLRSRKHRSRGGPEAGVEAQGSVAGLSTLSPLLPSSSISLSPLHILPAEHDCLRRSWASVVADGGAAVEKRGGHGAAKDRSLGFSAGGVSHGCLLPETSKQQENRGRQGVMSLGRVESAGVAKDEEVGQANRGAQRAAEAGNIKQACIPWSSAAGAGGEELLRVSVASHAQATPATSQRGERSSGELQEEPSARVEEQRKGALVEDSMSRGEQEAPVCHTKRAQPRQRVSTSSRGVIPAFPPSADRSEPRRGAGKPHGSLSLSFPVAMHPPTPHMGPLRMRPDGR